MQNTWRKKFLQLNWKFFLVYPMACKSIIDMKVHLVPVSLTGKCLLPDTDGPRSPYDDFFNPLPLFWILSLCLPTSFSHTHTQTHIHSLRHPYTCMSGQTMRHFDQLIYDIIMRHCMHYIHYIWETYMQVRKQQLELDMEQQTGSK